MIVSDIWFLELRCFGRLVCEIYGKFTNSNCSCGRILDSLFELYPHLYVSCTTVKQRNDTLGTDAWFKMGKSIPLMSFSKVLWLEQVVKAKLYLLTQFIRQRSLDTLVFLL